MKADKRFVSLPRDFWAHVRTVSEWVGYSSRTRGQIKVPSVQDVREAFLDLGLNVGSLFTARGGPTQYLSLLLKYFQYRAKVLNEFVRPRLMDASEAARVFQEVRKEFPLSCPIPMNKQKREKKAPAYFTGIVNTLIAANISGHPCDYDPRGLTTITKHGRPLRTLARRLDGAFPSTVNPIAVWEIKEYYYTTTFGSRVSDGVYESLLDGMELEELKEHEDVDVKHYLMLDARYTWWECGRSYLCRILDLLHMGYADEVLFGREVLDRLPVLAREWLRLARAMAGTRRGRTLGGAGK